MKKNSIDNIMLFIKIKINNINIRAFVDTGAQFSLMSLLCAKKCKLDKKIDKSHPGIAKGIGYQLILGDISNVKFQIENEILISNIFVSEEQPMEFIIGLDIIRKYQCQIDLKNNVFRLSINNIQTRFLRKDELPKSFQDITPSEEFQSTKLLLQELNKRKNSKRKSILKKDDNNNSKNNNSNKTRNNNNINIKRRKIQLNDNFTEKNVKDIIEFGFKRDDVIKELRRYEGNVNYAIQALIEKVIKSDSETSNSEIKINSVRQNVEIKEEAKLKISDKSGSSVIVEKFNEKDLETLEKFGFIRENILQKLNEFIGDLNKTIETLVNEAFKFN